jgi:hypothetical protein
VAFRRHPMEAEYSAAPRWLVRSGIVWLRLLGSWLLVGTILLAASAPGDITVAEGIVIASLAALALIATVSWGAFLGRRRATIWLWPAAAVGTAVQFQAFVLGLHTSRFNRRHETQPLYPGGDSHPRLDLSRCA